MQEFNYFNHEEYKEDEWEFAGGVVILFTFPNGYSGSVARHAGSYGGGEGLWEVAVMFGDEIIYDTPITHDVLGWQDDNEVDEVLEQIKNLPERAA